MLNDANQKALLVLIFLVMKISPTICMMIGMTLINAIFLCG